MTGDMVTLSRRLESSRVVAEFDVSQRSAHVDRPREDRVSDPIHVVLRVYAHAHTYMRTRAALTRRSDLCLRTLPTASGSCDERDTAWHRNKGCASPTRRRRKTSRYAEMSPNRRNRKKRVLRLGLGS